ncbi:glycosyltransferase [Francisellaceae bacterium]|nr:glycosyltransferase [Francisellaceae bacterium]
MLILLLINLCCVLVIAWLVIDGIKHTHHISNYQPTGTLGKVSIVVPVHNEQAKLQQCIESLCQQSYEDIEVIAVNDRSSDRSGEILTALSQQYSNLKVINITHCPEGWLGKTNALQKGAETAQGKHLIFCDADVHFDAKLVSNALGFIQEKKLDFLSIIPRLQLKSFSMKTYMVFQTFTMYLFLMPWKARKPNKPEAIGCGAFNYITREAFDDIGQMNNIALEPIDDIALAKQAKKQGYKTTFAYANDQLTIEWYANLSEVAQGLEKNIFAVNDFKASRIAVSILGLIFLFLLPVIAIFFLNSSGVVLGLISYGLTALCIAYSAKLLTINPLYSLLFPLSTLFCLYIILRSFLQAYKRRGILWGGKVYSVQSIKAFRNKSSE